MQIQEAGSPADQIDDFDVLVQTVKQRFEDIKKSHPLVVVDIGKAESIYQAYLKNLAPEFLHEHSCYCCHRFMDQFGNLAIINDKGDLVPVLWDEATAPEMYKASIREMAALVSKGSVESVFCSEDKRWGIPQTGKWTHFSIQPPKNLVHTARDITAYQIRAASKENHRTLTSGLTHYSADDIKLLMNLLQSDSVASKEKIVGPATFLHNLHAKLHDVSGKRRKNLIWEAVAQAPTNFCQPLTSVMATLIDDLKDPGISQQTALKLFAKKMHGLNYMRAQVAPSAGNIRAAEALFEKLGLGASLERRLATVNEIQAIWRPKPAANQPSGKGLFGHLQPKGETPKPASKAAPLTKITFEKFQRTVMPNARKIEMFVGDRLGLRVTTTAVHADAPPILQWDTEEMRNPFAGYRWHDGDRLRPSDWGLTSHTFVDVTAISYDPSMWNDQERSNRAKSAIFYLEGAVEKRQAGAAIFASTLKSSLHEVRSTLEAFSKNAEMQGIKEGTAIGYSVSEGEPTSNRFRVTTDLGVIDYDIDRWD